jgi:hypothetical protein
MHCVLCGNDQSNSKVPFEAHIEECSKRTRLNHEIQPPTDPQANPQSHVNHAAGPACQPSAFEHLLSAQLPMRLLEDSAVTIWVKHQLEKEAKSQAQYIAALRLEREKAKAEQAALAAQPGYRVSTLSPLRAALPPAPPYQQRPCSKQSDPHTSPNPSVTTAAVSFPLSFHTIINRRYIMYSRLCSDCGAPLSLALQVSLLLQLQAAKGAGAQGGKPPGVPTPPPAFGVTATAPRATVAK